MVLSTSVSSLQRQGNPRLHLKLLRMCVGKDSFKHIDLEYRSHISLLAIFYPVVLCSTISKIWTSNVSDPEKVVLCSCFYLCKINPEQLHFLSIKNLFIFKGHLSSVTYTVSFLLHHRTDFILKDSQRIKKLF